MEKIKFVETPICKNCSGGEKLMRRYSCIGCERAQRLTMKKTRKTIKRR